MTKPRKWCQLPLLALVCAGLRATEFAFAQQASKQAPATASPEEAKKGEAQKPSEEEPFDEVVKDMEVIRGLFTLYRKADESKILMEITPAQLNKMFLLAGTIEESVGQRGFYAAQQGADFPFFFRRVSKTIQWVERNTNFSAPEGSPAPRFVSKSFPDAILASAKILSKPHPERKSILIDIAELFLTD